MKIEQPTSVLGDKALEPYQPRTFVPAHADLQDVDTVVGLYRQLHERTIESAEDLEKWIFDRSELGSAIGQTRAILYINMTCQTDDNARAEAYKRFVETVGPKLQTWSDKLDRKFLDAWDSFPLPADRYEVYLRDIRTEVELFREENVELSTQVSLLSQEYQTLSGAMTVEFEGKEQTLPQMSRYLYQTDRELRQRAWQAVADRRLQEKDKLEELFDKMLDLRCRIADNAGCADFIDYQFRNYHRFDYTPGDCEAYHDAVDQTVVPLLKQIFQDRKQTMGLGTLRPWDTAVDPKGRDPLKPFDTVDELISGAKTIFQTIHPDLGAQFSRMAELGLLDLDSRKGKAPGGYQSTLSEARRPFIFANSVGVDGDVRTLLHEGGHAFHALAAAGEPLLSYRHAPMEFCEVASMSMELLGNDHLEVFYDHPQAVRSRREHLQGVVHILAWVATIDAFQMWIYRHPGHSPQQRKDAWLEISDRFSSGVVNYTGLEEAKSFAWHRQLHIFQVPFYYIEYGIAQLGALQLWVRARQDPREALNDYRRALSLGGSKPLPDLFEAAGLKFDFSAETIGPLMHAVQQELQRLGD
ncbi:MAG: M3 family oligoendopeptidase [Planctomycetota bacterium]